MREAEERAEEEAERRRQQVNLLTAFPPQAPAQETWTEEGPKQEPRWHCTGAALRVEGRG
eukprot:3096626-Rhodomonas_salina.3